MVSAGAGPQADACVARLECDGVLRRGRTALPSERLYAVLPCPSVQASAVAALLDEREGFLVRSLDPSAA
jgi:hypothetical protein